MRFYNFYFVIPVYPRVKVKKQTVVVHNNNSIT